MDAYGEIFSGLIRYGPDAHKFPDPYVGTVSFVASKQVAELKGLVVPPRELLLPDGTIIFKRRYTFREGRDIRDACFRVCDKWELQAMFERARDLTR